MSTVVLLGALDTKGAEYRFVRDRLRAVGVESILVDVGVLGSPPLTPDVSAEAVARAAGVDLADLRGRADRGVALSAMSDGATKVVQGLVSSDRAQGILGLGGTGGTTLISHVIRALPLGLPKLLVSTVASGDTSSYVGVSDITMMYSVVDIAGINSISSRILSNAAAAIAGMVTQPAVEPGDANPIISATMFGVTTPAVDAARARLDELGYEVLVFHATGTGGRSMEALVDSGMIGGVLDLTTTELADELVGGVFSAGSGRLRAAGRAGVPQVVSFGALDMVNFGPMDTVPSQFRDRTLHVHNASVTLMRTSATEAAEIGRRMAERLESATAAVTVMIPHGGFSAIDVVGQPFHDPAADAALIGSFKAAVSDNVTVIDFEADINDPRFALAAADRLHELIIGATSGAAA